ncbi:PT-VENN domain containing protein [Laribacter hongkongensis]|uniref:PT-VENN domain containing protein n=1 Tax=Laribacter hongkongensis TaxID=168471 RepID=A0A248LJD0_9NEIS|nr:PT-VENN domain containing protein [Laribacter hongkongensis]
MVGAALAQLKGGNVVAGAAGAGSAPLIAEYLQQTLYPDAHNLTEEQKQSISALTTVASGLLGGLAGGDSAGVLTGMQAGKNEVENNFLVVPAPPPPIPALQPPVVNTGMDGKPNLGEQISQEIKQSLSGLGRQSPILKSLLSGYWKDLELQSRLIQIIIPVHMEGIHQKVT